MVTLTKSQLLLYLDNQAFSNTFQQRVYNIYNWENHYQHLTVWFPTPWEWSCKRNKLHVYHPASQDCVSSLHWPHRYPAELCMLHFSFVLVHIGLFINHQSWLITTIIFIIWLFCFFLFFFVIYLNLQSWLYIISSPCWTKNTYL
jgi:hypothetical protein